MLKKVEKIQKGSNLITDGATQKDEYFIKEKEIKCPISVSQSVIIEPSQMTGESLRQALNPKEQVGKVEPEVDVGYPLQSATFAIQQVVTLGDSTEGTTIRPIGPMEATPAVLRPRRAMRRRPVLWVGRDANKQNPQRKDYIINRQNRLNAPGYIARTWAHYNN